MDSGTTSVSGRYLFLFSCTVGRALYTATVVKSVSLSDE